MKVSRKSLLISKSYYRKKSFSLSSRKNKKFKGCEVVIMDEEIERNEKFLSDKNTK